MHEHGHRRRALLRSPLSWSVATVALAPVAWWGGGRIAWPLVAVFALLACAGLGVAWRRAHTPPTVLAICLLVLLPLATLQLRKTPLPAHGHETHAPDVPGAYDRIRLATQTGGKSHDAASVNQGTLSLWFKSHAWTGDDHRPHDVMTRDAGGHLIYKWTDNRLYFNLPAVSDVVSAPVSATNLAADTWHHLAVVWDGSRPVAHAAYAVLYLDGVPAGTRESPFSVAPWASIASGGPLDPGGTAVTDVALWARPFAESEVQTLAASDPASAAGQVDPALELYRPSAPASSEALSGPALSLNRVRDGLMEQNGTRYWRPTGATTSVAKSADVVFAGQRSLHVVSQGQGGAQQPLQLDGGRAYVATAWIRTLSGAARIEVDGPRGALGAAEVPATAAGSWRRRTFTFTASGSMTLRLTGGNGSADFFVDDVSVLPSFLQPGSELIGTGAGLTAAGLTPGSWYSLMFCLAAPGASSGVQIQVDTTPAPATGLYREAGDDCRYRSLTFRATASSHRIVVSAAADAGAAEPAVEHPSLVALQPADTTGIIALWAAYGATNAPVKLLGLLLGLLLLNVFAVAGSTVRRVRWLLVLVLLAGAATALAALFTTAWPERGPERAKLLPLGGLLDHLPRVTLHLAGDTGPGGLNPNEVAGVLALLLPLAIGATLSARDRKRWLFAAAIVPIGIVLVLTQSRSGWFGALLGLSAMAAWRSRSARLVLPAVLLAGAIAGRGWLIGGSATAVQEAGGRVTIWRNTLPMIRDYPLTGLGIGQFWLAYTTYHPPPCDLPGGCIAHAHNLALQASADLGVPGAAAYLAVLGAAMYAAWRAGRDGPGELRWIAIGCFCGIAAFVGYGIFDAIAPGARGGLFLWLVVGLAAALYRASNKSRGSPPLVWRAPKQP